MKSAKQLIKSLKQEKALKQQKAESEKSETFLNREFYKKGGPSEKSRCILAFARSLGDVTEDERINLTVIEFSKPKYGYKNILTAAGCVNMVLKRWRDQLEDERLTREDKLNVNKTDMSVFVEMFLNGEITKSELRGLFIRLKSEGKQ